MCRVLCLLVALEAGMGFMPVPDTGSEGFPKVSLHPLTAPRDLAMLYLRFHEEELCSGMEAIFLSNESGIEIWGRFEDEGRHKKLLKILDETPTTQRVEIYAIAPAHDDDDDEEDELSPSLWENAELRNLLLNPLIQYRTDPDAMIQVTTLRPEELFKQRLMLFSEQTLDQGKQLKQFAEDLLTLTHMALDPSMDPDVRLYARKVCLQHSKRVEKQIGNLERNLKQAIPREKDSRELDSPDISESTPCGLSILIAEKAYAVSGQVNSFIYPDRHTVGLEELRNPSLFSALGTLRQLNKAYRESLNRASDGN